MATGILIEGCDRVQFLPDSIKQLAHLRSVELQHVPYVVIGERGLAWSPFHVDQESNPGLRILIHNSTIKEISSHAVQGRVDNILISSSTLDIVRPFAFSSLTAVANIELADNHFNSIEIQAFKKFTTTNFIIRGGAIHTLPSRFLSDVEVTNLFRMEGVTVDHVASVAFLVTSPKRVLVESNAFGTLEGDGFHMVTRGPITFRNNTFNTIRRGAFLGFSVSRDVAAAAGPLELLLDNSTVAVLEPGALQLDAALALRVDGLNVREPCACTLAERARDLLGEHAAAVHCWYALDEHFVSLATYVDTRCGTFKQTFWVFVVVGILVVLLVAGVLVFCIVRRENEKKKKVRIVLPDGKTYRETEFHIVVERAELLTTDL